MPPPHEYTNLENLARQLFDTLPGEVQSAILQKYPEGIKVFASDNQPVSIAGAIGDTISLRPTLIKSSGNCPLQVVYHEYAHIYAFATGLDDFGDWLKSAYAKINSERIARELEGKWTKELMSDEERMKKVVGYIESFPDRKLYAFAPLLRI
jgi:hypothetical protein